MRRTRLILTIVAAGVLIAAPIAYFKLIVPAYAADNGKLIATEDALTDRRTIVLASVDLGYLRDAEAKRFGQPMVPDLPPPEQKPESVAKALYSALVSSGSPARASIAIYQSTNATMETAVVVDGSFDASRIVKLLQSHVEMKRSTVAPNAWTMQMEDVDTCSLSKIWTVLIDRARIIALSAPDMSIIERLRDGAKAERDMSRWREFRKNRFAAAALFIPDSVSNQNLDPITRMTVGMAQGGLNDFDEAYLGASLNSISQGAQISVWMKAKSAQLADSKSKAWSEALASSRANWSTSLPTVAALHDHAHIASRESLLMADINLDIALVQKLQLLPAELIAYMFTGSGTNVRVAQNSAPDQEQIDTHPRLFIADASVAKLAEFDSKLPFIDPPNVSVGPLGIQLTAVRLTEAQPRVLELDVTATGTHLPNVGDNPEQMLALSIDNVRDKDGRELLRSERCGRDRNSLAGTAKPSFDERLAAEKKVRLIEGARSGDVATIDGKVRLRLPAHVETISLTTPKVGARIEREGLRIEVTQISANSLSFRTSGDLDRLLHVRAKNSKGEIIASGGSSSSGVLGAKSESREFRGHIHSIEWIVARNLEERNFPFHIEGAKLSEQSSWATQDRVAYSIMKKSEVERALRVEIVPKRYQPPVATTTAGPIYVDLQRIKSFRGLALDLALHVPPVNNLSGSVAVVQMESLTTSDGAIHRLDDANPAAHDYAYLRKFADEPYTATVSLQSGLELKGSDLRSAAGRVVIAVPQAFESLSISTANVGEAHESPCGPVTLTEISRDGFALEGEGDPACVYTARGLTTQDKVLSPSDARVTTHPNGWKTKVEVRGTPVAVEVILAPKRELLEFPFTFNLNEAAAAR